MTVLLLLTHRLHCRNIVSSGLAGRLADRGHRVVCLAPERDWADMPWELKKGLEFCPVGQFQGTPRRGRLQRFLMLGTMVGREPGSRTFQHKLAYEGRSRSQIALWRAIRRAADPEALARRIEALWTPSRPARRLVDAARPDALLWPTTFAQANEELEVVKACRGAGVPILAMPASFDTLSSKPSTLVVPDRLLVWGEAAAGYASAIGLKGVSVSGPPHWDIYGEPPAKKGGLEIMVAGTSVHYWNNEREIVEAMARDALLHGKWWIVRYRPHPSRLKESLAWTARFPSIVLDAKIGYNLGADFQEHICGALGAASGLVAAFSTLIVEAALLGRPSVIPAFATSAHGIGGVIAHAELDHMREVVSWPGVHLRKTLPGLLGAVKLAVSGRLPHDPAELRRRALGVARVGGAQERILRAVEECA